MDFPPESSNKKDPHKIDEAHIGHGQDSEHLEANKVILRKDVADKAKDNTIDDPLKKFEIDFAKFDRDKSGFLTLNELEIVEGDKSNDADMRRVAGLLKRDIESVEEYSNDEWFDENDGITAKDLHKMRESDHSVAQPGVVNWIRSVLPSFDNAQGIGIVPIPDPLSWGEKSIPTRILHVYKGSSAEYAGIESGDLIKRLNGQDITHMKHKDVLALIEGPKGTSLNLEVDRDGKTRSFTLERRRQISRDPLKTDFQRIFFRLLL